MYSGLRLGYTFWINISTEETSYKRVDTPVFLYVPQLVLFGCRVYFMDNFGVNSELCLGSPNYFAAGFNYRF